MKIFTLKMIRLHIIYMEELLCALQQGSSQGYDGPDRGSIISVNIHSNHHQVLLDEFEWTEYNVRTHILGPFKYVSADKMTGSNMKPDWSQDC